METRQQNPEGDHKELKAGGAFVVAQPSYHQMETKPGPLVNSLYFQVFIKTPSGMSLLVWVHATDCVLHLKNLISHQVGYPTGLQHLIFGGRALQDPKPLMDYNILPVSTIILNLRLRGGTADYNKTNYTGGGIGSSSTKNTETHQKHKNGGLSLKNILQGKNTRN